MAMQSSNRRLRLFIVALAVGGCITWLRPWAEATPSQDRMAATPAQGPIPPVVQWREVQLCQALGPAAPHPIWAVDSTAGCGMGEVTCEGRLVHRGRTIATSEAWLRDGTGKLLAHGTETCAIFPIANLTR